MRDVICVIGVVACAASANGAFRLISIELGGTGGAAGSPIQIADPASSPDQMAVVFGLRFLPQHRLHIQRDIRPCLLEKHSGRRAECEAVDADIPGNAAQGQ